LRSAAPLFYASGAAFHAGPFAAPGAAPRAQPLRDVFRHFAPAGGIAMSTATHVRGPATLALALGGLLALGFEPAREGGQPAAAYRLSGPYTHDNLTIFLIHGADPIKGKKFLTLDEALEQKKVIVHETKSVNQLSVENLSATDEVFIQAGDIVKGGQQDRLLAFDMIVPPRSGKVPIHSFCVEAGRWTGRGQEAAGWFGSAKDQAAMKDLKLAARQAADQRRVWDNVARAQKKLSENAGGSVKAAGSETSLQLTLEHKKLLAAVDGYVKKLAASGDGQGDVIGFAFAVNGQVNSADVYANSALFRKLWPKLLKASAVEAVAELKKDKKFQPVTAEAVRAFLADAEKGKKTRKEITKGLHQVQQETDKNVLFETRDQSQPGAPVRRSYIAK
jgi:hypothetical protein